MSSGFPTDHHSYSVSRWQWLGLPKRHRNTIHLPRACSSAERTKCTDMLCLCGINISFPHSRFTVCSADKLHLGLPQLSPRLLCFLYFNCHSDICDSSPASEHFKMRFYMVKNFTSSTVSQWKRSGREQTQEHPGVQGKVGLKFHFFTTK